MNVTWVVILFINGMTYMGMDAYTTQEDCFKRALIDGGSAKANCLPLYEGKTPDDPDEDNFRCNGTLPCSERPRPMKDSHAPLQKY